MQILKPLRRLKFTSLETLESRALMSGGVAALPKFSMDHAHSHRLSPAEIRTTRHDHLEAHAKHAVPRPHFTMKRIAEPSVKAQPTTTKTSKSSGGHAIPGVAPLKLTAKQWYHYWKTHKGRLSSGSGSGSGTGTGTGSGSGSSGGSSGGSGGTSGGSGGTSGSGSSGSTGSTGGTAAPSVPTQTLTPSMIRHAYGFDQLTLTGAGQTIAIVDAYDDPNIASDLQTFDQKYNLPAANFAKVVPSTGTPAYNSDWSYEIALDVEWAHAIAPGAKIVLVEAASASYTDLLKAVDTAVSLGANQVSMSWGGGEMPTDVANNFHYDHPGVTFTASSGDSGAGMLGPAASPYVVSVGGTTLSTDSAGNRKSETAWSGSGGGISAYQARPAYQVGFNSATRRSGPDVSYDANPNTGYNVYNSSARGWVVVGGTSAGAPQMAGLFALVNQGRAALGKASIGTGLQYGTNTALYALAGGTHYTNAAGDFYDVSVGSNGYAAGPGYDTVTGLGSPVANKLVPGLINM